MHSAKRARYPLLIADIMKTKLPLVVSCLLLSAGAHAQTPESPTYKHSVGIGFERVGLDAPDDIGNRY